MYTSAELRSEAQLVKVIIDMYNTSEVNGIILFNANISGEEIECRFHTQNQIFIDLMIKMGREVFCAIKSQGPLDFGYAE